jgi:predicted NAD/FAD-binding protein
VKIAIIGSGVSGLGAAYLLHQKHQVTVYEKNAVIGGHSRTLNVKTAQGDVSVDTGFIVFNYRNYPLLTGLFKHLDVPVQKSAMSFAASIGDGWLEYSTASIPSLFAQKRNLLRPGYWKMLADIMCFFKESPRYLENNADITLGECIAQMKMGDWFQRYFLLAMGGAIWSCPLEAMLRFPAQTFIRFFQNHGLLTVADQPQWYTVTGGSEQYVARLIQGFRKNIRTGCGVRRVQRNNGTVTVEDEQGGVADYNHVIFACHADQALKILADPSVEEKRLLGAFGYQPNRAILHGDPSFMPNCKSAWASWVYRLEGREDEHPGISLTYWMNNLQGIDAKTPLFVTLNPSRMPASHLIYDDHMFEHPIFDKAAIAAQGELDSLQGQQNSWFCGAYQRYGFHEDGFASGVNVAKKLGTEIPWS